MDEPTPGLQHLSNFRTWLDGGAQAVRQADAWFALFEERVVIRPTHRVYHWSSTSHPGVLVWLVFLVFRSNWSSTDDLWALVDEETGLIDAVVRRSGA